jgi:ABC-type Fe3+-siderophore transport system permease subunit
MYWPRVHNFARKIAVYYVALMFMGRKYQERVKNSFNTPDTTAVAVVSAVVLAVAMTAYKVANNHGYFPELMSLPGHGRVLGYPMFFLIYFINWRIWRNVKRPENELGKDSRELAERLPFWTIMIVFGIGLALFAFS